MRFFVLNGSLRFDDTIVNPGDDLIRLISPNFFVQSLLMKSQAFVEQSHCFRRTTDRFVHNSSHFLVF
ncbi:hypothetical protein Krac_3578 [Ktedonobacter racemifer DSM 44963]|uniref:Uncharacterized protein n=1 Tax=Ktedonobacter racemifer DSM 44963 TaxID=485913 RepID=D6U267_KTERA|nr:hypothetical protein Krac_3578 [Ktedonobacter racemifer DSM 44963]